MDRAISKLPFKLGIGLFRTGSASEFGNKCEDTFGDSLTLLNTFALVVASDFLFGTAGSAFITALKGASEDRCLL